MSLRKAFRRFASCSLVLAGAASPMCLSAGSAPAADSSPKLPQIITQFEADRMSLYRTYDVEISPVRAQRFTRFYAEELATLAALDFERLSHSDQVDYLLLKNLLTNEQHHLAIEQHEIAEMQPLLPFAPILEKLFDAKREMRRPNAEADAAALNELTRQIATLRKQFDSKAGGAKPQIDPVVANRTVNTLRSLMRNLNSWYGEYNGYDPEFTWWVDQPYKDATKALKGYSDFVKEKLVGIAADDKTTIIGDPVGREALMNELQDTLIPYTPEELIAIAQTEYDWCMREMLKASREMGYGDDWHKAVEKVKTMHVAPGEQPELIRKLVIEGSDFVKKNDLVTVPPLADETWRMIMMTPERQLVNPFFTGGNEISVSFPTDTMTYEQREMSMRGNNIPFARATAFHEMIPGHFLQFYMSARYNTYRQPFETPFWHEGNALYWEMLFWDKGFDKTPEERVGALVWRMHRSARVIFTMNFHLGKWTPQQCVQFLIDNVGFEPDNATAEVRRSFDGSVGPLYQCAYLMGALQFRALRKELVDTHRMTEKQFHDAILHENAMPIELLRADLEHLPLTRDYKSTWTYYGPHPTHP